MRELLLKDEVYSIVGAAMAVHNELKAGFLEAVYQEAMEIELGMRRVPFVPQSPITVYYKGQPLKKFYIADLACYGAVLVEIKVQEKLTSKEEAQLLNYLNATRFRVGVLLNFGNPQQLEWKRMVL